MFRDTVLLMTTSPRTIYVLMADMPDTHDVGSHDELLEIFTERATAEFVISCLIGKPVKQEWNGADGWRKWSDYDFEIEEWTPR